MQTLIYHLAKIHRLHKPLAEKLGKSTIAIQAQIRRGNPGYDERMRLYEAFKEVSTLDIHPVKLFSKVRLDQVHTFVN